MKRTPYFFEVFLALNTAFVFWMAGAEAVSTMWHSIVGVAGIATVAASVALAVRFFVAWRQHRARRLLRIVTSRKWLIDSVRIFIGLSMLGISYAWIKLLVPVLHPHVYDQELFALDQKLCFGISPSIFFLQLFSNPRFLRLIDAAYIQFFIAGIVISFGVFFSSPRRRIRIAFMTSSALMWLIGAWTYVLIPSLGPAYRFPEVWFPYAQYLKWTQATQAALMRNYVNLLRMAHGQPGKIFLDLGIAAFPSLHVATQSLVAIWFSRVWRAGTILFAGAAFFVFIGSMITGWHYLVDGIAGVALAYISYATSLWITKKEFR